MALRWMKIQEYLICHDFDPEDLNAPKVSWWGFKRSYPLHTAAMERAFGGELWCFFLSSRPTAKQIDWTSMRWFPGGAPCWNCEIPWGNWRIMDLLMKFGANPQQMLGRPRCAVWPFMSFGSQDGCCDVFERRFLTWHDIHRAFEVRKDSRGKRPLDYIKIAEAEPLAQRRVRTAELWAQQNLA